MNWSVTKDLQLMREMGAQGIFEHKCGSRERGNTWQVIATNLNAHEDFEVTGRSVRDRFGVISKKFKAKRAKELKATGLGGEEPTEYELLLEELIELSEECDKKSEEQTETLKAKINEEKQKALDTRQRAMETVGASKKRQSDEEGESKVKKTRRTGSETVAWLREKAEKDFELKEKELEFQRQERQAERENKNQQFELYQRQLQQQNEHHQQQQNIMQQQLMAILQQQQQQNQMFMKMFSTMKSTAEK